MQPALAAALNDPESEVRAAAAEGLAALPMTGADVPALLPLLKHKDAEGREQGAVGQGAVGPEGRAAIKPLAEALQDRSARARRAALAALGRVGADPKAVVPGVQKLLQDPDHEVRRSALDALGAFGPDAKGAARGVADAAQDLDLRKNAVAALVKIGPPAAHDAAPALASILNAQDREDRLLALDALIALKPAGPEVKDLVPKVIALLDTPDRAQLDKAVEALGKFGKPAVPALRGALSDTSRPVRAGAALALGEIGPAARDAAQALGAHAQADDDSEVRQACVKALSRMQR